MSGNGPGKAEMKAVIDTNILIDFLKGIKQAQLELARYEEPVISLISWMEILSGAKGSNEEKTLRIFLQGFSVNPIDLSIAERAVLLRRQQKLRLPDALILATSKELGHLLVTRNTRDFSSEDPGIRIPYEV
jgi:predicted nucleic acid-binding protein